MADLLRKQIASDVFDYNRLLSVLHAYKAPHRKITQLLNSGVILRIKKGLYVFSEAYQQSPLVKPYLANLMYGPSYVSQEYALSFYGLIPERVEVVTSMTSKRKKSFDTSLGRFTYCHLQLQAYPLGIQKITEEQTCYLIATPEKAILDTIAFQPRLKTSKEMRQHLFENLRVDENDFHQLNKTLFFEMDKLYRNTNVQLLIRTLRRG